MALLPISFFRDTFTPAENIAIGVTDLGMLRGFGVFDYFRTYNRRPFMLEDYLNRFLNSTTSLGLKPPAPKEELATKVLELIKRNMEAMPEHKGELACRLVLTGGASQDGIRVTGDPTFYMLAETISPDAEKLAREGMAVITYDYQRYLPTVKSTNYLAAIHLQPKLDAAKATEVLYNWQGMVYEGSRSNIFLFVGDKLVTPGDGILLGNTRKSVLSLAAGEFEIEERAVTMDELMKADEVFMTASGRLVSGVNAIDGKKVGAGVPGERTLHLLDKFLKFANG